jgi:octanoyl-[GcvH]:protein N-octanoyltransferase
MHVVRGSLTETERDRAVTRGLAGLVERTDRPATRAWTPPRQVAFGRRDASADGYDRARRAALERGYDPVERRVGGRAVAYTGETVAFVHAVPTDDSRSGIQRRYEHATDTLRDALEGVGATVRSGEPAGSFCAGDHSLQGDGKVAGIAQRVQRAVAVVGGCVVVTEDDEDAIADVLGPVYAALGVPFETESVGSVETAGGPDDPGAVVGAIERAFAGDRETNPVEAAALLS